MLVQARAELDKTRGEASKLSMDVTTSRQKLEDETARLQKEVDHWRERYEEQREMNGKLSAECESERRRSNNSIAENKDKKSQIHFLQRQVIYRAGINVHKFHAAKFLISFFLVVIRTS